MLSENQELQDGRYRILSQFGQGNTSVSYQAFDNVLQTKVIIRETFADQPGQYKNSITRQLEHLSSIKHESFTQVHGYFSEVDRQYLVTEATEGKSLKEILDRNQKPFPLFDVLLWAEQALNALNYLHSKVPPIIHCGITPTTLVLLEERRIKLLTSSIIRDFGARQNDELVFPYMSLELLWETLDPASQKVIFNSYDVESAELLESPVDERSSVYSLGATVYHLITGKTPINALERSIDLLEGKDDPLANPSSINSQIPRNFSAFLMKALELKREDRFSTVSEMRVALQPMLDLMRRIKTERTAEAAKPEVEEQSIREAALREVELAREALRKQREQDAQQKAQAEQEAQQKAHAEQEALRKAQAEQEAQQKARAEQEARKLQAEKEISEAKAKAAESVPVVPAPIKSDEMVAKSEIVEVETEFEKSVQPVETDQDDWEGMFDSNMDERKKPVWLIPAICAVVVLLVGGFFGMKFLNSSSTQDPTTKISGNPESPKTETPQNQTETPKTASTVSTQESSPAATTEPQPSATVTNPGETAPVLPTDAKPNAKKTPIPVQTVEKKPAATPAAAKTPAPKKKEVTVDDIIN